MTRIGILTTHPPGESLGTSKRVVGLARGLRENSVECVLLTPYPGRPAWWDAGDFLALPTSFAGRASATARRLAVQAFYRWTTIRRLALRNPERIRAEVRILAQALVRRAGTLDVDILQGEQQIAAAAACSVKRELRLPVVADLHNVWAAELVEDGLVAGDSAVAREAGALDRLIAREADGILVPNRELKDHFVERLGSDPERTWIVPTGATPHVSGPSSPPPPYRLVYSGGLSPWVRMDPFLDACAMLRRRGLAVEIFATGRGPGRGDLRHAARARGVPLREFWFPAEAEYFRFLATCHLGIVPWTSSASRTFAVPGKMYDYFAAGLPVLATGSGSWAEDVTREGMGRCVQDGPEEIAAALMELLADEPLRRRMGSQALAYLARDFSWARIAHGAAGAYEKLRSVVPQQKPAEVPHRGTSPVTDGTGGPLDRCVMAIANTSALSRSGSFPGVVLDEARCLAEALGRVDVVVFASRGVDVRGGHPNAGRVRVAYARLPRGTDRLDRPLRMGFEMVALSAALLRTVGRDRVDVLRADDTVVTGLPSVLVGKLRGIPVYVFLAGSIEETVESKLAGSPGAGIVGAMVRCLEGRVLRAVQGVLAVNRTLSDQARERGAPLVQTTTSFVEAERFPSTRTVTRSELSDGIRVRFLGRLEKEKGIFDLLEAADRILRSKSPVFTLEYVGDGSQRAALEAEIGRRSLGASVSVGGPVPHTAVPELLAATDLLVLPSYTEGSPVAVLEAMLAGVPVLASRVGSLPDLFDDGHDLVFVEAGNLDSIAAGLRRLVGDADLRRRISEQAAIKARTLASDYVPTQLAFLRRLLKGTQGPSRF